MLLKNSINNFYLRGDPRVTDPAVVGLPAAPVGDVLGAGAIPAPSPCDPLGEDAGVLSAVFEFSIIKSCT